MEIPKGHSVVMPYLLLTDAAGFIKFMEIVFGASVTNRSMRENSDIIMHAEVTINGSTVMLAEATEHWNKATANLFVYVDDADETYRKALANGATTVMELSNQSYGRTCGIKDPCDNVWWITSVKLL